MAVAPPALITASKLSTAGKVASVASSALPFLGGIFGSKGNQSSASQTNAFNAQEAQKNRDWQEYMSNTAHTREVADLRNAGLNPILSATGGTGASSPSGSTAHGVDSRAGSSAIEGYKIGLDKQLAIATINKTNQEIAESQTRQESIKADTMQKTAQTDYIQGEIKLQDVQKQIGLADIALKGKMGQQALANAKNAYEQAGVSLETKKGLKMKNEIDSIIVEIAKSPPGKQALKIEFYSNKIGAPIGKIMKDLGIGAGATLAGAKGLTTPKLVTPKSIRPRK